MVGDRHSALSPAYEGTYNVVRRNEGNAYILGDEEGMIISWDFVAEELKSLSQDSFIPKSESYEIEAIIKDSGNDRNLQYLLKWKNFFKHNSWVKETDYINAYWRRVQIDNKGNKVDIKEKYNKTNTPRSRKDLDNSANKPSDIYKAIIMANKTNISIPNIA